MAKKALLNRVVLCIAVLAALVITLPIVTALVSLNDGAFGCVSEDDCKQLINFIKEGDKKAFLDEYTKLILSGDATSFDKGEQVYVEDHDLWANPGPMDKVRRPGETTTYWVYYKYVND